jgi:RHS repeat-associated protein
VGQYNVISDAAGNLRVLADRTATANADRYIYDYRNRLIKVEHATNYNVGAQDPEAAANWSPVVDYIYDGLNRRVKKDLPGEGVDVMFLYDGWRTIEEREEDGANNWEARRQYVHGDRYIDELLIFDKDTNGDGDCTEGEGTGSTRYLYCHNNNYNVMALADAAGTEAERYKYDPYGACTATLGGTSGNPFRFQSQRLDADTGLYYFRHRDLIPSLGRFLQRDPIGYADGMNLYEAEEAIPTIQLDPMGRKPVTEFGLEMMAEDRDRIQPVGDLESLPKNRPLSYDEAWSLALANSPAGAHYPASALLCIMLRESDKLRPDSRNPRSTARGLTQILQGTAEDIRARVRNPSRFGGRFELGDDKAKPTLWEQLDDAGIAVRATAWYLEDRIMSAGGDLKEGIRRYGDGTEAYANAVMCCIERIDELANTRGLTRTRVEKVHKKIHSKEWGEGNCCLD